MARKQQINELMSVFMHFKRHMRKHLQDVLDDSITVTQVELLVAIQRGVARLKDLAEITYMTPSAVTQQVKLLEAHGYVEQLVSEEDRRERIVQLTEDGEAYLLKRRSIVEAQFAAYMHEVSDTEIDEFIRIMKKMIER